MPTPPPMRRAALPVLERSSAAAWAKNLSTLTHIVRVGLFCTAAKRDAVHVPESLPPIAFTWNTIFRPLCFDSSGAEVRLNGCHCSAEIAGTLRKMYWPASFVRRAAVQWHPKLHDVIGHQFNLGPDPTTARQDTARFVDAVDAEPRDEVMSQDTLPSPLLIGCLLQSNMCRLRIAV